MGDLNIITEADRYVFGKGCHYEIYRKLGSHLMELGGKKLSRYRITHEELVQSGKLRFRLR